MADVPTAAWFQEMRTLDRATADLKAHNDAFERGDKWRVQILPELRANRPVVAGYCVCGWRSGPQANWDTAFMLAGLHLDERHAPPTTTPGSETPT